MTAWERITFRPEGANRSRTIILRDPSAITIAGELHITGVEVDITDDEVVPAGVDERRHIITASLIRKRTPLVMNNNYAMLECG